VGMVMFVLMRFLVTVSIESIGAVR
jgi:hypothetical protein